MNLSKEESRYGLLEVTAQKKVQTTAPLKFGIAALPKDYLRIRDFEYAQPLYDLAYLLEVDATARGLEIPKYRTFSLWRAAYSLDSYSTTIDRWLDGEASDILDYVPSSRIRSYLRVIREAGTLPELSNYRSPLHGLVLRLRSIRGIGITQAAKILSEPECPSERWLNDASAAAHIPKSELLRVFSDSYGTWQSAHIVPPLIRLLHAFEENENQVCSIDDSLDGIQPVTQPFCVELYGSSSIETVLAGQRLFSLQSESDAGIVIQHQFGWHFRIQFITEATDFDLLKWTKATDPLLQGRLRLKGDLHLHTSWSDGNASIAAMAEAVKRNGLEYLAVTDHSRSCKLQGGLTPTLWLRQAASISLNQLTCPILHGIEVDILEDGALDLPEGLLSGMDIVIGSVHSSWTPDANINTDRLIRAIETGMVDIIGHPTAAIIGKPGAPNYVRHPANVDWQKIFDCCAKWSVALELNCFPSRLDLPLDMLAEAAKAGCWISLGSDAHARSHLSHLRFGQTIIEKLKSKRVLNLLSFQELKEWLTAARSIRSRLPRTITASAQPDLFTENSPAVPFTPMKAFLSAPQRIPAGSKVVGLDLTAGKGKPTGVALLEGMNVITCSLETDKELLEFIEINKPGIVSIDSPLGFPGGGTEIDPSAGIVRVAEHDLSSVGIPAYPALIDSMRELTSRGVRMRKIIESFKNPPGVIESYPGAAQDVLCIPRKQKSLELLRSGLRELGIDGPGLLTESHDEMDAITSAIVGRFYEAGEFLPMGIPSEAQLIVPRIKPLRFDPAPIICLGGKTGAGKSVVARYLALFYGFQWIRTLDIIRDLLIKDAASEPALRKYDKQIRADIITDQDLRDFGLLILEKYSQQPLRIRLGETINNFVSPIVVDSIRDLADIDDGVIKRPVFIWFIECTDQAISNRLMEKSKIPSFRNRPSMNPIDQRTGMLREHCHHVISNTSTLEELRWKIDDIIFDICGLSK